MLNFIFLYYLNSVREFERGREGMKSKENKEMSRDNPWKTNIEIYLSQDEGKERYARACAKYTRKTFHSNEKWEGES